MAAAVDPTCWDAAAKATGSVGAIVLPVRGRTPQFAGSPSILPAIDAYARNGWVHRDERYRPCQHSFGAALLVTSISPLLKRWRAALIIRTFLHRTVCDGLQESRSGTGRTSGACLSSEALRMDRSGRQSSNASPNSPIALLATPSPKALASPTRPRATSSRRSSKKRTHTARVTSSPSSLASRSRKSAAHSPFGSGRASKSRAFCRPSCLALPKAARRGVMRWNEWLRSTRECNAKPLGRFSRLEF
jgi:hypothetical protein